MVGPRPHPITPDLAAMAYAGQTPLKPTLGSYDIKSVCQVCQLPVLCRTWPLKPWEHVTEERLAELYGEAAR